MISYDNQEYIAEYTKPKIPPCTTISSLVSQLLMEKIQEASQLFSIGEEFLRESFFHRTKVIPQVQNAIDFIYYSNDFESICKYCQPYGVTQEELFQFFSLSQTQIEKICDLEYHWDQQIN